MKNLLIAVFAVCSTVSTDAQPRIKGILSQDAIELKKMVVNGKIPKQKIPAALQIISYYTRNENGDMITDADLIIERINKNLLLRSLLPFDSINGLIADSRSKLFKESAELMGGGARIQGGGLESIFPASTIADGLGTFIAERFKEELTMRYLEGFRRKIVDYDSAFFYSRLLPKTYESLLSYPNVFDYKAFLTVLKEAFKDDLDHVSENVLPFIDENMTATNLNSSDFYISLAAFDLFVNKIPESTNALQSLSGFRQNVYFMKVGDTVTVKKVLTLASLLTETLQNNDGYLESKADRVAFFKEFTDLHYANIFFGLFVQQYFDTLQKISFGKINLVDAINNNVGNFKDLTGGLIAIQLTLQNYRSLDAAQKKDILPLLIGLNNDFQNLLVELNFFVPEPVLNDIRKALRLSERLFTMSKLAIEEKYGLVIVEILKTLEETNLRDVNPKLYEGLNTYGLFIANVAQAESGQEVKEALDVAALPVGSYKIKRNALVDVSLNAYPGVAGGLEFRRGITATSEGQVEDNVLSVAFAVPVGLGFSWGSMKEKTTVLNAGDKRTTSNQNDFKIKETVDKGKITRTVTSITGRSHSLFISMIDIGAVTSYRLTDEETEKLPEFTWENILAPGVYYFFGFKNTPLSIGGGVQYGPQLRTITDTDIKIADRLFTARILLSVDVPIFNFFSRTTVKEKNQLDKQAFYK